MKHTSVIMIVAKYPATHGHTSVINNLCLELKNLGYKTAIGSFRFEQDPPNGIQKVKLSKLKLLFHGISSLDFDIIHSHQTQVNYFLMTRKSNKPILFHYHGASNKIQKINFKISMFLHRTKFSKILSVSNAGITQMKKLIKKFLLMFSTTVSIQIFIILNFRLHIRKVIHNYFLSVPLEVTKNNFFSFFNAYDFKKIPKSSFTDCR